MAHFESLENKFKFLLEWADLRHEQRADVAGKLKPLERQFDRLRQELERLVPPVAAREPDELAAIRALRGPGARKLWTRFDAAEYRRRVAGAWLARAAGCTLGAIVEMWSVAEMEAAAKYYRMRWPATDYWPATPRPWATRYDLSRCADYTKSGLRHVPVDDDLTYTLLGLLILEEYGPKFTTEQVGKAWKKYLPLACTAEKVALENLRKGVSWRQAGVKDNPYMEWIGADIRSDPWGYAAPGWPEKAAELAYRDAFLSHRRGGIYGAMYFAAVVAAAFAVDEPLEACRIGLSEIPEQCRLADDVRWALRQAPRLKNYRHARRLVDERFAGMSWAGTNNNACLTIFGLALGGHDVTRVLGETVALGLDNDCTAATAGSIIGACRGINNVPPHWYKPFRNRCRTYLKGCEWFSNTDIVRRFANVARAVWAAGSAP